MTGKSETARKYPASLAVAMLSAIKRQMISDGAIRVGELHLQVRCRMKVITPTELEGKRGTDGTWIYPKWKEGKNKWST